MNTDFTLIDKYFKQELSDQEQLQFNQLLDSDEAFLEEFAFQRSMHIFFEASKERPELIHKLERFGNQYFKETAKPKSAKIIKNRFFRIIVSAAAIGLLFILFNPFSSSDLYQDYAHHQNLSLVVKSDNSSFAQKAEHDFNTHNYKQAISDLKAFLNENPNNQRATLSLGISYLETDQFQEAISIFEKIQSENSTLKHYGTWYLALTYVKKKDFAKAKELLKRIPSSDGGLFEKAKELLKELEK